MGEIYKKSPILFCQFIFFSYLCIVKQIKGDRDMTKEEEVILREKFTKFNIFTRDGNKEVTAPRRMTLDEAMRHFKALAISGIE